MDTHSHRAKRSIRTGLYLGFGGVVLLTAMLGTYGSLALRAVSNIVGETYDRPLMAINFARSADVDFVEMQKAELQQRLGSVTPADAERRIAELAMECTDDLVVARERALGTDEQKVVDDIKDRITRWVTLPSDGRDIGGRTSRADASAAIAQQFDTLIELATDHGFVERRKAIRTATTYTVIGAAGTIAVLLLSAGVAYFLARRIVRPLSVAVAVAMRIGKGDFAVPIPAGGSDETGVLLRSMALMQSRIADMLAHEQAQRQSAQGRLADAVEGATDAILLIDEAGKVVLANSQFGAIFPTIAPLFRERPDMDAFDLHFASRPDLSAPDELDVAPLLALGEEVKLSDGRWIRLSSSRTRNGGFFLTLADFTDIKRREEQYRAAKALAEAASAAKTAFLSTMSHELRTPLNAIIGFSDILLGEYLGPLGNEKYREFSGNILTGGQKLLAIVNAVLEYTQAQSATMKPDAPEIDLADILEATIRRHVAPMKERGLEFRCDIAAGNYPVRGDARRLGQALDSILSNAIEFTETGSISVGLGVANGLIVVRIADTGIGMTEAEIETAFEPFGQVDSSLSRPHEGIGLGLPLARALTEFHGGRLKIESERNIGTVVSLTFPLASDGDASQPRSWGGDARTSRAPAKDYAGAVTPG